MIFIAEPYREGFRQIGFAAQTIFDNPAVKPWRVLEDRQNCTWDVPLSGRNVRLHVKRFPRMRGKSPAELEAEGYQLLRERGIPSAEVAAWGTLEDGRSFIATEDLAGFSPADKLVEVGSPFDRVLIPTADLAAPARRWAASSRFVPLPFHGAIFPERRGGDTPDRRGPRSSTAGGADAPAMDRQRPGTVLVQHAGDEYFGCATE